MSSARANSKVRGTQTPPASPVQGTPFIPAVKESAYVKACIAQGMPGYEGRYKKVVSDARTLSKTELQALYPAEYNSLRSRKQQAKENHIHFANSLKDIRDWLIHLGPRPAEGHTVDRIKGDKTIGYRPKNLRWATKTVQTQNRRVTKWHVMPEGPPLTTKELANKLGLPYLTLYKRLLNGWTMERLLGEQPKSIKDWNFPPEISKYCEERYPQRKTFTTTKLDWFISHFMELRYKPGLRSAIAREKVREHLDQARDDHFNLSVALDCYEDKKLRELSAALDPTFEDRQKALEASGITFHNGIQFIKWKPPDPDATLDEDTTGEWEPPDPDATLEES